MNGFVFDEKPTATEPGEGSYLYLGDGTEYLDFGASYAVATLGHSHPAVTSAIQEQAAKLTYVQALYPVEVRTELYEKLATLAPGGISNTWLCSSGAEANEAAMKFAHSATDRQRIAATGRAFYGCTLGNPTLMWKQKHKKPYEPVAGGVKFVSYSDEAELAGAVDDETAAVFLEPIQDEGDANLVTAEYLQTARDLADDAGAALVFDGIQTGIGRTGALWACENADVAPDILTNAKGIADGLPPGTALCADWIADDAVSHGSTFSGGPVVRAAANATLDTIVEEDLPGHATAVGDYLTTELETAVEEHDLPVREVRGDGLMVGVEVKRGTNRTLKRLALSKQLLVPPTGRTVVRFLPPLAIEGKHTDRAVDAMTNVLS